MTNQPRPFISRALPRFLKATYTAGLLPALIFLLNIQTSQAGSATWKINPASDDWNTVDNWLPSTVPNGPADTAMFAFSQRTDVSISARTEVDAVVFNPGSRGTNPFTISLTPTTDPTQFTISGAGITNNTGEIEYFVINGPVTVRGQSAEMVFLNNATVDDYNIHFTIRGGPINSSGSHLFFSDRASAGGGTFTVEGGSVRNANGGNLLFGRRSTADHATLIAQPSVNKGLGGRITFADHSQGGRARVQIFGRGHFGINDLSNGVLDISLRKERDGSPIGLTIGSLEGDGLVFLGRNPLTIGSNGESTHFSGFISDGGGIGGGSLIKIGVGKLVLSYANTYTGGTTIERGKLVINNRSGSGTGSGPVHVNAGTLGGKGVIAGAVSVGTGSGAGASLAPGVESTVNPGTLTIQSALTFSSDATYALQLNSATGAADKVSANGVTIDGAAQAIFTDLGSSSLPKGIVLTVIDNTAATPIAGTFSNLADGMTFTSNGNTYRANYHGGDGNDLTLMVVP